jgi:acyl-CoA thioester hydrolase
MLGLTASKLRSGEVHLAAVQQNIAYQKELYPGDTIAVRTGVLELREKVLRFRHELYNTEGGEVASTCEFTVVCLDPQARKSRPFPAECAEKAQSFMIEAK